MSEVNNPLVIREAYEPGNMTRYELLYIEWDDDRGVRMFTLTHLHGASGRSFSLRKNDYIDAGYMTEKTGWRGSDLAALMGYLSRRGVSTSGVTNFDEYGNWKPQEVTNESNS